MVKLDILVEMGTFGQIGHFTLLFATLLDLTLLLASLVKLRILVKMDTFNPIVPIGRNGQFGQIGHIWSNWTYYFTGCYFIIGHIG